MPVIVSPALAAHNLGIRETCGAMQMPDIYEIRLRNLTHLRGEERGGARRLAEQLGMTEGQMSQLLGEKHMGSDLARSIEEKLKLPYGWLDTEYHDLTAEAIEVARDFQSLSPEAQDTFRTLLKQLKK